MIKLNETYSLDADKYQFILIERVPTAEGSKHAYSEQKTFHPSIDQVIAKIADIELKALVERCDLDSLSDAIKFATDALLKLTKEMEQQL